MFCSFIKNREECKDRSVLLKRTDAQPWLACVSFSNNIIISVHIKRSHVFSLLSTMFNTHKYHRHHISHGVNVRCLIFNAHKYPHTLPSPYQRNWLANMFANLRTNLFCFLFRRGLCLHCLDNHLQHGGPVQSGVQDRVLQGACWHRDCCTVQ